MNGMQTAGHEMDAVGFDFGTTNSSVAIVNSASQVQFASFPLVGAEMLPFRSVLYFEQLKSAEGAKRTHSLTGPAAIERYLQTEKRVVSSSRSSLIFRAERSLARRFSAAGTSSKT
jgi:hypothetical chaperone protein